MILSIHFSACGLILVNKYREEAGHYYVDIFTYQKLSGIYVESLYFMTTTISTVGYGDFKGYIDNSGTWSVEMGYLIFVTIAGIILFSSVTNEIFTYKKLLTVSELVNEKVDQQEEFLYEIG